MRLPLLLPLEEVCPLELVGQMTGVLSLSLI